MVKKDQPNPECAQAMSVAAVDALNLLPPRGESAEILIIDRQFFETPRYGLGHTALHLIRRMMAFMITTIQNREPPLEMKPVPKPKQAENRSMFQGHLST